MPGQARHDDKGAYRHDDKGAYRHDGKGPHRLDGKRTHRHDDKGIKYLAILFISLCLGQTAIADETADAYTLSQAFLDTLVRDARVHAAENRVAEARERLWKSTAVAAPRLR